MGVTVAGTQVAGETAEYFAILDDGSVRRMTVTNGTEPVLSKPGRWVTEEEYKERLAEIQTVRDRARADQEAQDRARTWEDYQALRAAGVPEASARRMSGYKGEDEAGPA